MSVQTASRRVNVLLHQLNIGSSPAEVETANVVRTFITRHILFNISHIFHNFTIFLAHGRRGRGLPRIKLPINMFCNIIIYLV